MTMHDALLELDPGSGIRIHRSHWVSMEAVNIIDEKNKLVELIDGRRLPISTSRLVDVSLMLSQKDGLAGENGFLFETNDQNSALAKLSKSFEANKKELDRLFLDIYRGKAVGWRRAYKIAELNQKVAISSPVQLTLLFVVICSVIPMGSYGTFTQPFHLELLYWVCIYVALAIVVQSLHFVVYLHGLRLRLAGWVVALLLYLTECTSAALVMYLLGVWMFGDALATLPQFLFGVFISNAVFHAYAYVEMHQYRSIAAWEVRMNYPPIVLALPHESRGKLMSVSANGRYVNVTTTAATASLRMPFKDAVQNVGKTSGLQIHRSHWVASEFLSSIQVNEGVHTVELTNGQILPMSKASLKDVDDILFGG